MTYELTNRFTRVALLSNFGLDGSGVTVRELQAAAGNDSQLSKADAGKLGIEDAKDIDTLNLILKEAKKGKLKASAVIFTDADLKQTTAAAVSHATTANNAPNLLNELSNNAFDDSNPDINARFDRLRLSMMNPVPQGLRGDYKMVDVPTKTAAIDIADMKNVSNFDSLASAARDSLRNNPLVQKELGQNPSDAQMDAWIKKNLDTVAQHLGDDFDYQGKISFTGDTSGFKGFEQQFGVCTDIHAAVTSLRKSFGQEAYLVHTSGNDASHVFSIYKDNATGTWNIQNYGKLIQTDAKSIRELYDTYMPEQRTIALFDIAKNGEVTQKREVLTETGLREQDFRNNLGAGNYDPTNARNGIEIGANNISLTLNRWNFNFNPMSNTFAGNYHVKKQDKNSQTIQGVAGELQNYQSGSGHQIVRGDLKYEYQTIKVDKKSDSHTVRTQHNAAAWVGAEQNATPIYWRDAASDGSTSVADKDTAVRLGGRYAGSRLHILGKGPVKAELGYGGAIGATATLSATSKGQDIYETYAGRMLHDAEAKVHGTVGARYENTDLVVRAGVSPTLDLSRVNGINNAGEQIRNVAGLEGYGSVSWRPKQGPVAINSMATVNLLDPTLFRVGAGIEAGKGPVTAGAMVMHNHDPLLGSTTAVTTGIQIRPRENVTIGGHVGITEQGSPMGGAFLRINF